MRHGNSILRAIHYPPISDPATPAGRPRYSLPFFMHPNPDFRIATLPSCLSADNPDRYPDAITADDFLMQRLREIKLL